jgi:hypothetical protein
MMLLQQWIDRLLARCFGPARREDVAGLIEQAAAFAARKRENEIMGLAALEFSYWSHKKATDDISMGITAGACGALANLTHAVALGETHESYLAKLQRRDRPMPWCEECGAYHHDGNCIRKGDTHD